MNYQVDKGNVAFGTGFNKWAISYSTMKQGGISFNMLYDYCLQQKHKERNGRRRRRKESGAHRVPHGRFHRVGMTFMPLPLFNVARQYDYAVIDPRAQNYRTQERGLAVKIADEDIRERERP